MIDDTFYLVGSQGIVLVFIYEGGLLDLKKKPKIINPSLTCYSEEKELFLISVEQTLEIWDSNLDFPVYTINFDSAISLAFLSPDQSQKRLMIYDQMKYYEIDLNTLKTTFWQKLISTKKGLVLPVNLYLVPSSLSFDTTFFKEDVVGICFFSNRESLDLFSFPFDTLQRFSFDHNKAFYIMEFASYYFKQIQTTEYVDDQFGPLSPLLFAIYLNDTKLLQILLEKFRYPSEVKGYWSPLSFAFRKGFGMCVVIICEHLLEAKYKFKLSKLDFCFLLESNYLVCHDLVSKIPQKLDRRMFYVSSFCQTNKKLYSESCLLDHLFEAKKRRFELKNYSKNERDREKKIKKILKERVIDAYHLDIEFAYQMGTPDSVKFLDAFNRSNSEQFITGKWKQIVENKAGLIFFLHFVNFVFYVVFTVMVIILMIYSQSNLSLIIVLYIFTLLLSLFEITKLISFFFLMGKR